MSMRDVRRHVGQLLIGSFAGEDVPVELRALAREFDLGGVSLFARNIASPEQVAGVAYDVRRLGLEHPAWVAVDQEGGRVARLRSPFTEWPAMATLGRADDAGLATRFAGALAAELRAVGVSFDYAPVLDVHTNPENAVIGDRALSDTAERVGRLGARIITVLQEAGVAACGKHFPGHGDTSVDSHEALPVVEHPPDRLRAVELLPFRAAIDAGVGAIMTAHVLVPAWDGDAPVTLSRPIVRGVLRDELGFDGVVLSDDLEMKAIASSRSVPDAAVAALGAGCDGVLVCSGDVDVQAAVLERVVYAVEAEELPRARVEDAMIRQRRLKERMLVAAAAPASSPLSDTWRPPSTEVLRSLVGCGEHRAIAEEMAQYA